jgi:restriction endonuclease S subunit
MELNIDRSKWKKVRLGDVATAPSIRINNPSESEFDRFIGNANIGQWDFRLTRWEHTDSVTSAMKGFETGDYLFVRRSLYASDFRERSPRATFPGVCSGDIITIRENPEMIADGFLIGVLNHPAIWKFVVANASGSITRRIKWRDLANYEFLLPPKDQQAKLTELLWAADEMIRNVESLVNRVGIQKQALQKTCFQKTSDKSIRLENLTNVLGGFAVKSGDFKNEGKPVIKIKNVSNGRILIDGNENHVEHSYVDRRTEKYLVKKGDILIAMTGATLGKVGRVQAEFDGALLNQRVGKFELNECSLSDYVYAFLESKYFLSQIFKYVGEGAQGNVSPSDISRVFIPEREIDECKSFSNKFCAINDTLTACIEKLSAEKLVLKSLINQIF